MKMLGYRMAMSSKGVMQQLEMSVDRQVYTVSMELNGNSNVRQSRVAYNDGTYLQCLLLSPKQPGSSPNIPNSALIDGVSVEIAGLLGSTITTDRITRMCKHFKF